MKSFPKLILGMFLLSSLSAFATEPARPLDWMLGCWTSEDGSAQEVWVRQSDDQLIGSNVALDGDRVGFYEVLNIRFDGENVHYTAHPKGQARTTFSARSPTGEVVSFTKPDHDYPQRIEYRLEGNELIATISLLDGNSPNSFPKVRCEE